MRFALRSWLIGVVGLLSGASLFAFDTIIDMWHIGPPSLHVWIECLEFTIVGPGLGLGCLVLMEHLRTVKQAAQQRERTERDRRFQVLGRVASAVAHEVRNPLHTLRLVVDELRLTVPQVRGHELGVHIDASLERIDRAVDLVYQLARPRGDEEAICDLVPVLKEVISADAVRTGGQTRVALMGLPDHATVRMGSAGLRIVLDNLLRNAREAGGANGTVVVSVAQRPPFWNVSLVNPGRVDPLLLETVGNWDGDSIASEKSQGLGIGLLICRHLIGAVDGRLSLQEQDGTVVASVDLQIWNAS